MSLMRLATYREAVSFSFPLTSCVHFKSLYACFQICVLDGMGVGAVWIGDKELSFLLLWVVEASLGTLT